MKLKDFIEKLEELKEEYGSNIEVKIYDTQGSFYDEPLMIKPILAKPNWANKNIMVSEEWDKLSNIKKSKNCTTIIGIK